MLFHMKTLQFLSLLLDTLNVASKELFKCPKKLLYVTQSLLQLSNVTHENMVASTGGHSDTFLYSLDIDFA